MGGRGVSFGKKWITERTSIFVPFRLYSFSIKIENGAGFWLYEVHKTRLSRIYGSRKCFICLITGEITLMVSLSKISIRETFDLFSVIYLSAATFPLLLKFGKVINKRKFSSGRPKSAHDVASTRTSIFRVRERKKIGGKKGC